MVRARAIAPVSEILESALAKVYQSPERIPPHPGEGWTRFVCISDTHSRRFPVPPGDVLVHAGDLSQYGDIEGTLEWIKTLGHLTKIIIAGNHDLYLDQQQVDIGFLRQKDVDAARSLILSQDLKDAGIHYLEHEPFRFATKSGREWKVYGSPVTRCYSSGSFQYSTSAEALATYAGIPSDTEILITHTPPHMTLDRTRRGQHVGCEYLAQKLDQLTGCRLHVFGHIHEAHGACIVEGINDVTVERVAVNAALYNGMPAITVDLKN